MNRRLASDTAAGVWWDQAACRGLPSDWFLPLGDPFEDTGEEPWDPDPKAALACAGCPVRVECLDFALARPELRGTWGGLTFHQRRQAKRIRRRQACPACYATDLVEVDRVQVCLSCATSWRVGG